MLLLHNQHNHRNVPPIVLTVAILCHVLFVSTAFFLPKTHWQAQAFKQSEDIVDPFLSSRQSFPWSRYSSPSSSSSSSPSSSTDRNSEQNRVYIQGLMSNLGTLCDKYIMNGSPKVRERVFYVLDQIAAQAMDDELIRQSIRMVKRAGVPMHKTYLEQFQKESDIMGKTDAEERRIEALKRKEWEQQYQQQQNTPQQNNVDDWRTQNQDSNNNNDDDRSSSLRQEGLSALSRRQKNNNGRPDLFTPTVLDPDAIATIANDKNALQEELKSSDRSQSLTGDQASSLTVEQASARVSEMIARAGSGDAFDGQALGIGGLDSVLVEIKRRIWTPLAAPPQLLKELGIHPVRGLLLYGKPGCGKTLLASTLGSILSPFRPITVVSGPEVLDKFVGSSEKNLRAIFDEPPSIYDNFRLREPDGGEALENAALHVVVMDEFDAIARSRGGSDGKGGQGDAGVARDSVVNQLLAKMDGVQPLKVPTLVIGLTNKRSLIEPALLRPGRFEVQIEIPPPRTVEQRVSILKVHTKHMFDAGRLQVSDPPPGTAAAHHLEEQSDEALLSYDGLLQRLAVDCDGFSGAALAGVARAAASHALERAVDEFSDMLRDSQSIKESGDSLSIMEHCLVTQDDFYDAITDIQNSMGTHDHSEEPDQESEEKKGENQ
ncbi:cell division cycle protein 48 [Nitzschia inconspicua]|uniref:Vesicle-fusing ATPase n=1 Tax=Nitzschia inconspicua TaxID=303405 RepID=A0A9K3PX27_9STRA|nr:cell division cycle protein 48 [Nitzschia inconspicua]